MWLQIALAVLSFILAGKPFSWSFDGYKITAKDVGGAPVHLTIQMVEAALLLVLAGQPGTVQVGDVKVTVEKE